jgi:hypothetical protein
MVGATVAAVVGATVAAALGLALELEQAESKRATVTNTAPRVPVRKGLASWGSEGSKGTIAVQCARGQRPL